MIALEEAIQEIFGRDIEPSVNRIIKNMMPHLPDEAVDMVSYLLEFSTREQQEDLPTPQWEFFHELTDASSAIH